MSVKFWPLACIKKDNYIKQKIQESFSSSKYYFELLAVLLEKRTPFSHPARYYLGTINPSLAKSPSL